MNEQGREALERAVKFCEEQPKLHYQRKWVRASRRGLQACLLARAFLLTPGVAFGPNEEGGRPLVTLADGRIFRYPGDAAKAIWGLDLDDTSNLAERLTRHGAIRQARRMLAGLMAKEELARQLKNADVRE